MVSMKNDPNLDKILATLERLQKSTAAYEKILKLHEKMLAQHTKMLATTDKQLKNIVKKMFEADEKTAQADEAIRARVAKNHDEIMNIMDGLAKDYSDLRDENASGAFLLSQADDRLDDHEERIAKLEKSKAAA